MADISTISGGLPPANQVAASTYNPTVGATSTHPSGFPAGTPLVQSSGDVVPGSASTSSLTARVVALAVIPGVVGSRVLAQMSGPLTLAEEQWDVVTGDSGGLVEDAAYYLANAEGRLTRTPPSFPSLVTQVGIASSSNTLLIQIYPPRPGES